MANPLRLHQGGGSGHTGGPPAGTQQWCDWRNSVMVRNDIEWIMGSNGPLLTSRAGYAESLTKQLADRAEDDRQKWIHRHNHPERYV